MTYHQECTCRIEWSSATGTHDTVTGEWLPEATTTHVKLIPAPDCPMHPSKCLNDQKEPT